MSRQYTKIEILSEEIFRRKAVGETNREIGESYGLTKEQVKNLVKRQNRKQRLIEQGCISQPKGRPRKNPEDEEQRRNNELIQLRMQVELLRLDQYPEAKELMMLEHRRWCYVMVLQGWSMAGKKDADNLKTPYLTHWAALRANFPYVCLYDLIAFLVHTDDAAEGQVS